MPEARSLREFWGNIVSGRDCITDVPASRWNVDDYYDPDPAAPDKTYCKRGGFIPDVPFDPVEFGLPPNILEVTDVHQLLALVLARRALEDAGYDGSGARPFDRERTGVILGIGGGQKLITPLTSRLQYPVWKRALLSSGVSEADADRVVEKIKLAYVPWEENSFPGMLGNVISGRVANRLDLGGINCVVDAACASSLSALKMALSELTERRCDMMLTGGIDTDNSIFMYLSFSKTPAFSRGERLRAFDADSDGMMLGEGLGMLVLKRLEDAERDGDRIYATIKGIGTASDGRFKSIYAPRSEGQARALRRAYENADVAPGSVGLIEAHGTGTVAGDMVEATTLVEVLGGKDGAKRKGTIALGSVKSQIGHTKSAAGAAGMIKAALALHHKVLPPTINVTRPHPEFGLEDSPVYLNARTRPWVAGRTPRRAGVSSFGFGGTNYHVVLEEHSAEASGAYRLHPVAQPLLLAAPDHSGLTERARSLAESLLGDGAETAWREACREWATAPVPSGYARLGFAAESAGEARTLLATAVDLLSRRSATEWEHPKGIWYRASGMDLDGRVAVLFPGQGSQYVEMGRELACNEPDVRETFAALDSLFERDGRLPLSRVVYPAPAFDDEARAAQAVALQRTENAQPAIGALSAALYRLLGRAGFRPDVVAGHSFGELTALWAAGALDDETYFELACARGAAMAPPADPEFDAGTMLSVQASVAQVNEALAGLRGGEDVRVANVNSPRQVVIAGARRAVAAAGSALEEKGLRVTPLPVSAAFHTPLVGHAQSAFGAAVERAAIRVPRLPVYSNATGEAYPVDAEAIRAALVGHILQPVQFEREVERLYEAGARLFVEVGPRSVLTNLVGEILADRPHVAVALNASRQKDSDQQLRETLVRLKVLGLALDLTDRHAAPQPERAGRKLSGAAVLLNGANYVSEKTRGAYETALNDGHRIAGTPPAVSPQAVRATALRPTPAPAPAPTSQPTETLTETLTVIESGLTAFGQQQSDSLRAHQQYLEQQAEQSRVFLQLIQQQQELLLSPGGASVPREAHETLARSLALYQELQVETARAHQAYLQQHAEHARLFAGVLGGQRGGMQAAVPAMTAPPAPVAPLPPAARPAPVVAAPPVPAPVLVPAPVPVVVAAPPPAAPPVPVVAPAAPAATPVAVEPAVTVAGVTEALLEVVSEKTGYPVETLELEMDIEADLGIDSIKRVEILGAMRDRFPTAPTLRPAEMAELRTLRQIVSFLEAHEPASDASSNGAATNGAPTNGAASNGAATNGVTSNGAVANGVGHHVAVAPAPWTAIRLKQLPPADRLEIAPPPGSVCVVTDDGTPVTSATVGLLASVGWRVAVLRLPGIPAAPQAPAGALAAAVATDSSEEALRAALDHVSAQTGPIGTFIHLSPTSGGPALFGEVERASVRHAFLLAKVLQPALTSAAASGTGRAAFMAVTRLDGALGSGLNGWNGSAHAFTAESGGLYGLVKTLRLEWPGVHCRAVDASPTLTPEQVAAHVLAEYLDPDGLLAEVGLGPTGRVTLAPAASTTGTVSTAETAPAGSAR